MNTIDFPMLKEEDISVRIAQFKDGKGAQLLLYKDARVDINILNSTVGIENWQKKFYRCGDSLFCSVGILFDNGWVWKDDCGSESNVEKEKGEASDSFKRACVNWGIGIELYTSPFIWVPADKLKSKYDKFSVEKIAYDGQEISGLTVFNETTKQRVFAWKRAEK